jgi:hypothetical protein
LVQQSIYKSGKMEIIVIISGSEQNEEKNIEDFQKKHPYIRFLKTNKRESLYKAWNRGIKLSCGEYITNANTDDRHHQLCLETLVDHLENNDDLDLVYGNLFKSSIPNERFHQNDQNHPCFSQKFFAGSLLLHNFIGAQPVWRKSLHDKIGLFDESYEVIGDYEFILNAATKGCRFSYVNKAMGLMLWHQNALSTKNQNGIIEKSKLLIKFRNPKKIHALYRNLLDQTQCEIEKESFLDLGVRSLCYYPQFFNGMPQFDFGFAKSCFEQRKQDSTFAHNLASLRAITNNENISSHNCSKYKLIYFYGSSEDFPTEHELKGVKPIYLKRCNNEEIRNQSRQKFAFDLKQFHEFLFGHIPLNSLSKKVKILIWGFNERGKLLGNYLNIMGFEKVRYIDSTLDSSDNQFMKSEQKIISINDIKKIEEVVFILAMSSQHWNLVTKQIIQNFKNALILKIDHS